MIVKVQISIATMYRVPQMLIYNRDRSIMIQDTASDRVKNAMKGRDKAFFDISTDESGFIRDMKEVPWESW